MEKPQIENLLRLYKSAIARELTAGEFSQELQVARIKVDESFAKTGSEDKNLGEYLQELANLENYAV